MTACFKTNREQWTYFDGARLLSLGHGHDRPEELVDAEQETLLLAAAADQSTQLKHK